MLEIKWVRLRKYVELSGDTVKAVMHRRREGKWADEHCKLAPDGHLWVNLPEVEEWIEEYGMGTKSQPESKSGKGQLASVSAIKESRDES